MVWNSLTSFLVSFDAILYKERMCTLTFQELHHSSDSVHNTTKIKCIINCNIIAHSNRILKEYMHSCPSHISRSLPAFCHLQYGIKATTKLLNNEGVSRVGLCV